MVLTKKIIDNLAHDYSVEAVDFREQIVKENISIQIAESELKYLLIQFCDLRLALDEEIEARFS